MNATVQHNLTSNFAMKSENNENSPASRVLMPSVGMPFSLQPILFLAASLNW